MLISERTQTTYIFFNPEKSKFQTIGSLRLGGISIGTNVISYNCPNCLPLIYLIFLKIIVTEIKLIYNMV